MKNTEISSILDAAKTIFHFFGNFRNYICFNKVEPKLARIIRER